VTLAATLPTEVATARRNAVGDVLRRTAARHPDRLALVHGRRRATFADLNATVNRVAHAIAARGLRKGDRVALLSHNSFEFVVAYLALAKLGVVSVPINFMLSPRDVAFVIDHSGAQGLLVEDGLVETADEALAVAEHGGDVVLRGIVGATATGWEPFAAWADHDDESNPDIEVGDDDPVQILYTSGTESRPKGAVMTSRNLISQHVSCIVGGDMAPDDIEIHALPLYHTAQLHCFLSPDLYLGATSVILDGPSPIAILSAIAEHRATKLFCPPTVWIDLLRAPEFDELDVSSLRKGYYGAASMPVEVLQELSRRLPDVRLYNFYGQTEMSPVATILRPEDQLRKAGSAGRPGLNVETILVDDDDRPVNVGEVGEIVHRGPHAMIGYWNDPGRTADAFRSGWFHSGDLGIFDDEGYLTVVDRKKDMINSGGENVASREVEETIYEHPSVAETAVFGVPHPRYIEAVVAVVVVRPGLSLEPEELREFCRSRLSPFKVPKAIRIAEGLPKNPSGKILKKDLRDAWDHDPSAIRSSDTEQERA
jgi:fatty-acyl-CoA synthase